MPIRVLEPRDARAFRDLRLRALREHPEAFGRTPEEMDSADAVAERFRRSAGSDADAVLGAFDGDALVGVAGCHRADGAKRRHVAVIWGVYVAPEWRRTGVARRLFLATVAHARTWPGLDALWLDVTTVNAAARALYASCGFESAGLRPRALKVGDRLYDEELMILRLSP